MAILLEGINAEFLSLAASPSLNAAYGVHFRFRLSSVGNRQTLFYADAGTAGQSADWWYIESDNTLHLRRLTNAGSTDFNELGSTVFVAGVDYELFVVRSGTTYSAYLNNSTTPEVTATAATTLTAATRLSFGAEANGQNPMDGSISDPAVWTEAVSQSNRALVSAGSCAAYTTNQWGRWTCDTHTALSDLTGNSRTLVANGTLSTVTNPVVPTGSTNATVTPTGFAVTLSQGTPVSAITITPTGFALTATRGTPTPSTQSSVTVTPTGLALSSNLGTFNTQNDMTIQPSGGALGLALGTPTVAGTTTGNALITPAGFALGLSLGQIPTQVLPAGMAASLALGTPTLAKSQVIKPVGFLLSLAQSAPNIAGAVSALANIPIRKGWITRRRGRR